MDLVVSRMKRRGMKRIVSMLLVGAMAVSAIPMSFAGTSQAAEENILKGKKTMCTYQGDSGHACKKAVDGKLNTSRWGSNNKTPQAIQIDLGAVYEIDTIKAYLFGKDRKYTYEYYVTMEPTILKENGGNGDDNFVGKNPVVTGLQGVGYGWADPDGKSPTLESEIRSEDYTFTDNKPVGRYLTLRVTKCDHIVCLWDIAAFGTKVEDAAGGNESDNAVKPTGDLILEAENGTLSGKCQKRDSDNCSNGQYVGYIGEGVENTVTWKADVKTAGTYTLEAYFLSKTERAIEIKVNEDDKKTLTCQAGTDWDQTVVKSNNTIEVKLKAGENTIVMGNDEGESPNVDCLALTLKEAEEATTATESSEEATTEDKNSEEATTEAKNTEEATTEIKNSEEATTETANTEETTTETGNSEEATTEDKDTEKATTETGNSEETTTEDGKTGEEATTEVVKPEEDTTTEEQKPGDEVTTEVTKSEEDATTEDDVTIDIPDLDEEETTDASQPDEDGTSDTDQSEQGTTPDDSQPEEDGTTGESNPGQGGTDDETQPGQEESKDESKPGEDETVDADEPGDSDETASGKDETTDADQSGDSDETTSGKDETTDADKPGDSGNADETTSGKGDATDADQSGDSGTTHPTTQGAGNTSATQKSEENVTTESVNTTANNTQENTGGNQNIPASGATGNTQQSANPQTNLQIPATEQSVEVSKGYVYWYKNIEYKVTKTNVSGTGTVEVVGTKHKNITSVTIPASIKIEGKKYLVTSIGKNAFKNCKKLKKIVIKTEQLKKVGKNAWKGIKSNARIKVPSSVLKKYTRLFKGKGLGKSMKIIK